MTVGATANVAPHPHPLNPQTPRQPAPASPSRVLLRQPAPHAPPDDPVPRAVKVERAAKVGGEAADLGVAVAVGAGDGACVDSDWGGGRAREVGGGAWELGRG